MPAAQYLKKVAADAADQAADQHDERQLRVVDAERVVKFLDRERRIRVDAAVALGLRAVRRRDERVRIVELGHQAVDRRQCASPPRQASLRSSSTRAAGSSVRISKIEIIGRKRRNRNSSVRNRPIVPK